MFPIYISMPKPRLNHIWQNGSSSVAKNFNFSWSKPAMNISQSDTAYQVELLLGKIDISKVEIDIEEGYLINKGSPPQAAGYSLLKQNCLF